MSKRHPSAFDVHGTEPSLEHRIKSFDWQQHWRRQTKSLSNRDHAGMFSLQLLIDAGSGTVPADRQDGWTTVSLDGGMQGNKKITFDVIESQITVGDNTQVKHIVSKRTLDTKRDREKLEQGITYYRYKDITAHSEIGAWNGIEALVFGMPMGGVGGWIQTRATLRRVGKNVDRTDALAKEALRAGMNQGLNETLARNISGVLNIKHLVAAVDTAIPTLRGRRVG